MLRLEYIDVADLQENPHNWRSHPPEQVESLKAIINEVGFAGALLYNETTKRLIDGACRKKVSTGKVPVLIGQWTEEQEKLILATLDPIGAMAEADKDALSNLLADLETNSTALNTMFDDLKLSNSLLLDAGKEFDESCANDVKTIMCPHCGGEFPA